MEKSESIKNLASALILFQIKVGKIKKDATNPFFKSKYASLSNIQDAITTPLEESGISIAQFPDGTHGLTTIIMHGDSGEWMQSTYTMKPVKDDPQGIGSCITYQKRYAIAGALGLNIDDDDDGNAATHGGSTPEKAKQKAEQEAKTEAEKRQRDLNAFIAKLEPCKSLPDLQSVKKTIPEWVLKTNEWRDAANKALLRVTPKKELETA